MTLCATTCSSSTVWNSMTDSIAEYQSTPLGCVCPNQMQILMMSSSWMEEASNRVPLPQVNTKMYIQLERSITSLGIWSLITEVVIAEVVDITVGWRWICKGQHSWLREICWLSQMKVKSADFQMVNVQYMLKYEDTLNKYSNTEHLIKWRLWQVTSQMQLTMKMWKFVSWMQLN